MRHIHLHTPDWTHRPGWHTIGERMDHLVRDPRFWAGVALAVLVGLMLLTVALSEPGTNPGSGPVYPSYPFIP